VNIKRVFARRGDPSVVAATALLLVGPRPTQRTTQHPTPCPLPHVVALGLPTPGLGKGDNWKIRDPLQDWL